MPPPSKKLGQILLEKGWLTNDQLNRALQNQGAGGHRLGTNLLDIEAVPEDMLLRALAEQLTTPSASVDDLRTIAEPVIELLPPKVALRCRAVPFRSTSSSVDVAILDPRNLAVQDELGFVLGKRVKIHLALEVRILEALEKYYQEQAPKRVSSLLDRLNRAKFMWDREGRGRSQSALPTPLPATTTSTSDAIFSPPSGIFKLPDRLPPTLPTLAPLPPPAPPPRPLPRSSPPPAPAPPAAFRSQSAPTGYVASARPPSGDSPLVGSALTGPSALSPHQVEPPLDLPPVAPWRLPPPPPNLPTPPAPPPLRPAPEPAPRTPSPPAAATPSPPKAVSSPVVNPPAPSAPTIAKLPPLSSLSAIPLAPEERDALRRAAAPPALITMAELETRLANPTNRDEVAQLVVDFLAQTLPRVALFMTRKENIVGWLGRGRNLDAAALAQFETDYSRPSVFLNLRQGSGFYRGPLAPLPVHRELARCWGGRLPRECLLVPVRLRDRLVTVIYADADGRDGVTLDLDLFQKLAERFAAALEACIVKLKSAKV